jgi:hypothetical protein
MQKLKQVDYTMKSMNQFGGARSRLHRERAKKKGA